MLRRHVERFEVVVIVFELRALRRSGSPSREEDGLEPIAQERQRMPMAEQRLASGQRDVDGLDGWTLPSKLLQLRGELRLDVPA